MSQSESLVSPARMASAWWPLALLAVVAPTLIAAHDPPSVTFYNQVLAVLGWGLFVASLGSLPSLASTRSLRQSAGLWAVVAVLLINALEASVSSLWGHLPGGLGMMGAGLSLAALLVLLTGWRVGHSPMTDTVAEAFFAALCVAGVLGMGLGWVQVFHPAWADGVFIAEPTMVGRAVGNLRQPNHFSTLLVWSCCGVAWLGARRKLPVWLSASLVALFIGGVVWTASRTGMVGMVFLTLWGALDKRLPRALRWTLLAAPLVYGAWWGAMYLFSQLDTHVGFAAAARLHDGSDISSSRFKIWANVIELIRQQPWTGVGYGEFNIAWTLTPFPTRPVAFFDHTHNLALQWAVELGLPVAGLMLLLCAWGLWALGRPLTHKERTLGSPVGTVGATAVMVALAGLHSLLEYPLWYSYFLLPTAFAWGLGLAARQAPALTDKGPVGMDTHEAASSTMAFGVPVWVAAGALCALTSLWCAADYLSAANIYAPRSGAGPLAQRIAFGQSMPWFGYQADYADVTGPEEGEPSRPPQAFRRTLHNLLDARLMIAYARSLAASGQEDKARAVVARLKEFHNPMEGPFMAPCKAAQASAPALPFQCTPAQQDHTWRELLPD